MSFETRNCSLVSVVRPDQNGITNISSKAYNQLRQNLKLIFLHFIAGNYLDKTILQLYT